MTTAVEIYAGDFFRFFEAKQTTELLMRPRDFLVELPFRDI